MVEAVLTEGFDGQGFHRIELIVIETNKGAHRFYVNKLGFRDEGLIRDIIKLEQNYLSWYSLSLLADEWRARGRQVDAANG
jgi:RimJ/RimL family protein N-acetyltransferase